VPLTKHPYSCCCAADIEIDDTDKRTHVRCSECTNSNVRAVIDERPFVYGDVVKFRFKLKDNKLNGLQFRVDRCYGKHRMVGDDESDIGFSWMVALSDGGIVFAELLELVKGNDEIRD
jgi:hypothetical protein